MSLNKFYFNIGNPVNPVNPVAAIKQMPNETIDALGANYPLTSEQRLIARLLLLELAQSNEITVLDLVEKWESNLALLEFARAVRRSFLPE